MVQRFTRQEFLAKWKTLKGFAPLRNDVAVTRCDGLDFDTHLEAEMDAWYWRLVRDGDVGMLATENLADVVVSEYSEDGCVTLVLPPEAARVTCVRLSGWSRTALLITDPECNMALRQLHPYTRSCSERPVAVLYPDRSMSLYPATPDDRLVTLECVMLRDDEFVMDSSALDLCINIK